MSNEQESDAVKETAEERDKKDNVGENGSYCFKCFQDKGVFCGVSHKIS